MLFSVMFCSLMLECFVYQQLFVYICIMNLGYKEISGGKSNTNLRLPLNYSCCRKFILIFIDIRKYSTDKIEYALSCNNVM